MKTKNNYLLLLLILLLGFAFYWIQWRPMQIRKSCEWEVFSKERVNYTARENNKYRHCLIRNGLKPESLFVNTKY